MRVEVLRETVQLVLEVVLASWVGHGLADSKALRGRATSDAVAAILGLEGLARLFLCDHDLLDSFFDHVSLVAHEHLLVVLLVLLGVLLELSVGALKLLQLLGHHRLEGVRGQVGARVWLDVRLLRARLTCLLYTSPSPRDQRGSRMPSSA